MSSSLSFGISRIWEVENEALSKRELIQSSSIFEQLGHTCTYANSCLLLLPIGELLSGMHAYGLTRKTTLLTKIPAGVVTLTEPDNAPGGTDVSISPGATIVKVACTPPLKVTSVAPDKLVPKILTIVPTGPDAGDIVTKGGKP